MIIKGIFLFFIYFTLIFVLGLLLYIFFDIKFIISSPMILIPIPMYIVYLSYLKKIIKGKERLILSLGFGIIYYVEPKLFLLLVNYITSVDIMPTNNLFTIDSLYFALLYTIFIYFWFSIMNNTQDTNKTLERNE